MAWTAIFISLLSLCVSGAVLFLNYKDGKLIENLKVVRAETGKLFDDTKKRLGEKDDGGLKWDKVRERLNRIETMIREKNGSAGSYMEVLEQDLSLMRDYASEKGSAALGKTIDRIKTARERLGEDAEGAADRVKELSMDLAGRIKNSEAQDAEEKGAFEPPEADAAEKEKSPEEDVKTKP